MAQLFQQALARPRDAAGAQLYVTRARPSSSTFLQLATFYNTAHDRRDAQLAAQKALELANPAQRVQVRAFIRQVLAAP
jgi:hypothetical protein